MTSDSDPDYSDAEQISQVEIANHADREKQLNADGVNVCGKDVNWVEVYRYATAKEFNDSEIGNKIVEEFTARKEREFDYADVKIYHCKYSRRVGFKPCPWMFKVSYLTYNSELMVETNDWLGTACT